MRESRKGHRGDGNEVTMVNDGGHGGDIYVGHGGDKNEVTKVADRVFTEVTRLNRQGEISHHLALLWKYNFMA